MAEQQQQQEKQQQHPPPPNPTLKGHKLLFLTPWIPTPTQLSRLQTRFPDLTIDIFHEPNYGTYKFPSPEELPAERLEDVTVLLTWRAFPAPERVPKLVYVQLLSAGVNHLLDRGGNEESRRLFVERGEGVGFCTASGVHPPQIAEWVIATYLAHQHELPKYLDAMKEGNWIQSKTDTDVADSVGQRMAILGYGAIGRQCARLGTALGMSIIAYTRSPRPTPTSRTDETYTTPGLGDPDGILPSEWYSGSTVADINTFLSQDIDLLVIATPLTELTRNLIAAPQLELLSKKKAFICNIGRGAIVNTDDLVDALERGLIRGAALDVTEPEPLPRGHRLWGMRNVIVTPHVSGNSTQYNERVLGILEYNLGRLGEGKGLTNRVSRENGY